MKQNPRYRKAEPDDIKALSEFYARNVVDANSSELSRAVSKQDQLTREMKKNSTFFIVATTGEDIVGYAWFRNLKIKEMVSKPLRDEKAGEDLIKHFKEKALKIAFNSQSKETAQISANSELKQRVEKLKSDKLRTGIQMTEKFSICYTPVLQDALAFQ